MSQYHTSVNSRTMALSGVDEVTDVHEQELVFLRRSMEMLKSDNKRLHEKADHLESSLLFYVEQVEEKNHAIEELKMQLSYSQVRERELRKELDGIDKPFRKSSIFGRTFSRKNSMMSMHSSSHDTVHSSSMHVSQSSPFLLSTHDVHGSSGGLLNPNHQVVYHRGISNTLSSCDDVTSIALSARASPDLSSVDGDSSGHSYQRLGSTSGGGSVAGLAVSGDGNSPHEVTAIEYKSDEDRENQGGAGGGVENETEEKGEEGKKEKPPKRKRSLWMRVTSGLPKIPGEFVV